MKKIFIALFLLLSVQGLKAQILHPVKWSYGAKKLNATEAMLIFKATIEDGWHIYSQNVADGGPTKTVFAFNTSPQYSLVGKTTESQPIVKFEKMFNMKLGYFEKQAVFQQKVKLKSKNQSVIKGSIEFGACDDTQCIPPDQVTFAINIK